MSPALIASRIICEKVADQGGLPTSKLDDHSGHKVDKLTKVDQRADWMTKVDTRWTS